MSIMIHLPVWRQDGDTWHLLIGNESVAQIIPSEDTNGIYGTPGALAWLSVISDEYPDYGWHAVDFPELDHAKALLTTWWLEYASRHVPPDVRFECPLCAREP
ncbi:MAG: hypothetical protein ACLPKB_20515 [Xanthobacteraceae bacterium]